MSRFPLVAPVALMALFVYPVASRAGVVDFDGEASVSAASTSNLFGDSTAQDDTYTTASLDLKVYPLSFARVNLAGGYTYYGNFFNLSNLVYGGGLTLIPTSDSSRFSLYLNGNYRDREYREPDNDSLSLNANEFAGSEYEATVAVGYKLTPTAEMRTGVSITSVGYDLEGVIDRRRYDLTAGANVTLPGGFSVDLEGGYSGGKYQHIDPVVVVGGDTLPRRQILPGDQYTVLLEEDLRSIYISPRVSGPLGWKTAFSLTLSHRQFLEHNEADIIYGYSTGYLSPWLTEFAGEAAVVRVKTYLIPRLIVTLTTGYWQREHLQTVESEWLLDRFGRPYRTVNLLYAQKRADWRRRLNVRVQWPLVMKPGLIVEPSLEVDYTDNNSTVRVYDHSNFSLTGGLTVRF